MKGKIVTLVLLFLASLLFPYTMTILCFDTGLMSYQPEDLYSVVLENEKTVSAEQYLVGILAQEIDPSMEQETLKAQAILARRGCIVLWEQKLLSQRVSLPFMR